MLHRRAALAPIALAALGSANVATAADPASPDPLAEIVVTATRLERSVLDTPSVVHVISAEDARYQKQSRTLPDLLKELPGIMVQKTGHGQGSPFIRGFTGFRNLFLIDGIRLNNSVFRDGPNQYWNTVDPLSVERLELVKGPGSVLYGSDAIGGTVNALTREPGLAAPLAGDLYYRYADAEAANIVRTEIDLKVADTTGLLAGVSVKDFGDLEAGSGTGLQPRTGYDELDADFKLTNDFANGSSLSIAHQRVDQDDAWRTHPTVFGVSFAGTAVGSELQRSLNQDRTLSYVQYQGAAGDGWLGTFGVTASYQTQEETQTRIRSDGRRDEQGVDVGTLGLTVQLSSPARRGEWIYGFEHYHDEVSSSRQDFNQDGTLRAARIQGPVADDAEYDLFGAYLERHLSLSDRVELIAGGRYNRAAADARRGEDPLTGGVMSVKDDWSAVVGNLRAVFNPRPAGPWRVFGSVSQGFRAPNLSDLTRLDTAASNEIETPVAGLVPEKFISYELGTKASAGAWAAQAAYYYTDIDDLIVRTPTGRVIDGDFEVTKRNASRGYVQGIEIDGRYQLALQWSLSAGLSWMDGEADVYPTSDPILVSESLDRLMPLSFTAGLRWQQPAGNLWVEGVVTHADRQDDLSSRDRSDTQRIPPGGTPAYTTIHLRAGFRINESTRLALGIENLTDEDYRIHGSGLNEPGRNLTLILDWHPGKGS